MPFIPSIPLIQGISYSWAQIQCVIEGIPFIGITAIDYKEKQNKTNNMGIGIVPISRGYGNLEYEGSIEFYQDDLFKLRAIATAFLGKITSIPPFNITILFDNPLAPTIHTLQGVEFMNNDLTVKQGDTKISNTINILIANILWQI